MNARAGADRLIEVDEALFVEQVKLREKIVDSDPNYYCRLLPEGEAAARETAPFLLEHIAHTLPQYFALERQKEAIRFTNRLLQRTDTIFPNAPSFRPLHWLGRQVQEDLILMQENTSGESLCVGGHLCFAADWALEDKIGKPFLAIHDPVPGFRESIGAPSDLLMRRLKPGRPAERFNWSLAAGNVLNRCPKEAALWKKEGEGITPENAPQRVFLRVERQTLSRLPLTGAVLFTIHTTLTPLAALLTDAKKKRRLTSVLQTMPDTVRRYKGIHGYEEALMECLMRGNTSET